MKFYENKKIIPTGVQGQGNEGKKKHETVRQPTVL